MNIVGRKKIFYTFSVALILLGAFALVFWRLEPGIDFVGGSLMEIRFEKSVSERDLAKSLSGFNLGKVEVVSEPNNAFLVRTNFIDENLHQQILKSLRDKFSNLKESKFETIGPSIGKELKNRAIFAGILALLGIALYVGFAFYKVSKPVSSWKYGIIAVLTLFHDAFIALGVYTIWAHFSHSYADSALIVALLTVMGYSVNDTIVVFDRTRENLRKKLGQVPFTEIVNLSVNETISRSINTSLTTCLPLLALLVLGPPSLFNFALVILVGVLVGTYSSIFIASPLLVSWSGQK